ncbi:helix-turn-helix transcriptional regulator [Nonomuraea sp. NPDC050022]|uniref:helix-turn-helix transcriptional regulator n=1 Tax=unclassified Nonomuraea TaxID=2593643 RepID=UPI0033C254D1
MTKDERLWTLEEVSEFLGIPVGTLYQWRARRIGPRGRRVGKYVPYLPADVRTWFQEQP